MVNRLGCLKLLKLLLGIIGVGRLLGVVRAAHAVRVPGSNDQGDHAEADVVAVE